MLSLLVFIILSLFITNPSAEGAPDLADYTAYPPFASTGGVDPNVLLVLDHSGSMQFPAYIGCEFGGYDNKRAKCGNTDSIQNPEYGYDLNNSYYGYFKNDKYYEYGTNKFEENPSCTYSEGDDEYMVGDSTGTCISGNLLNWAIMSRIDLMRKVLIGGKSVSLQGNAHTLRAEGGWRTFSDHNLGCTFELSGGSYPNLDHELTISNYGLTGTCGYLTVWANGSSLWGMSDKFRYVYQTVSGDFDVKLLVVSPPTETGQTYAKAGLMARASTSSNSRHVMAMATNGAGLQFANRSSDGGSTSTFADYEAVTYPVWVRLTRSGNTFKAYYSKNGNSWNEQGSTTFSMPADIYIGMATSSYSSGKLGSGEFDEFICDVCSDDDFEDYSFNSGIWTGQDINTSLVGSQIESCGGTCRIGTISGANTKIDLPEAERRGVIHNLSDKDYDGDWDDDSPRFGLMVYASDNRYGEIKTGIDGSNMSSFLTALQNEPPYNGTPTGEALREAYDYFNQNNNYSYEVNNAYIGGQGSNKDPMYESGTASECRRNFVLLISDGEWNGSVDPIVPARENFVNDIRPVDIDGFQNIATYAVYTFGDSDAGRNSLQQVGMFGNFDDYDGNTWPYNRSSYPSDSRNVTLPAFPCNPASPPMAGSCSEWDKDDNGLPDGYYEASDGNDLESALIQAISDLLKQSSSGTAVSVLATTGEGEGAVYQAYFYPQKLDQLEYRKWLGYVHALFVDQYGNLREDSDNDSTLDLTKDMILEMEYSAELGSTVNKYRDLDGNGAKDSTEPSETAPLENINALWKGGESLWQQSPLTRTLFTSIDGYTELSFSTSNAAALEPYLRADDVTEAENIIKWTQGDDIEGVTDAGHADGYRKRSITIDGVTNVWKLGDIIYSTPTVVGRPMENYDLLYGDEGYLGFRKKHLNRRRVVYAGANDGMLHAFNAGCFDEDEHKYYTDVDADGDCVAGGKTLGEELWAFIPRGILPHLKWNTLPDYTHVYHVDLKPKIVDIPVFTPDDNHKNGWGTVLVGGFRYGGKQINWTSGGNAYSASPEYFALDITDPLDPRLLWTFSDPDLGLTMSNPAGVKISEKGYAIFGSGATDYDSGSNLNAFQDGYIYVLDLSSGTNGVIDTWNEGTNFWKIPTGNNAAYLADPISVDVDIDYDVDVMYIGENYRQGANWNALMRRITTSHGSETDPSQWVLSTLGNINDMSGTSDAAKRITSSPSVAMDDRANLWTFFGSGQFLGTSDKNSIDTGAFYGIKDGCWDGSCSDSYTNLIDISAVTVKTDGTVSGVSGCGGSISTWSDLSQASHMCDGWAMYFGTLGENVDFTGAALSHAGERMLTKPLVLGGLVTWATYIPGADECSSEGESNVYAVYYKTGSSYIDYVFKEQKDDGSPSDEVARTVKLGVGLPSSLSAQITESGTSKGFVQQSTGTILEIESVTPISLRSGIDGWKSKAMD